MSVSAAPIPGGLVFGVGLNDCTAALIQIDSTAQLLNELNLPHRFHGQMAELRAQIEYRPDLQVGGQSGSRPRVQPTHTLAASSPPPPPPAASPSRASSSSPPSPFEARAAAAPPPPPPGAAASSPPPSPP